MKSASDAAVGGEADLILRGATVITMTDPFSFGEPLAVAIRHGHILALVDEEHIHELTGLHTQVIDLSGKTLLPGFIDSHVHFTQTGLGRLGPALYGVRRHEDVLRAVAVAVDEAPSGQAILVHGLALADLDVALTGADLNAIDFESPIMIGDVGAHACVLNRGAMSLVGLPADTPGMGSDGVFTAQANTMARYRYYEQVVSDEVRVAALQCAARMALEVGITTVHALEGGCAHDGRGWMPMRDAEILLREQRNLPVHTLLYYQSTDVQQALDWGLDRIGGCIWVDGAYDEHTAALLEPYCDCGHSGSLYFTDEEIDAFVERAHCAGLQISMHAIGDAAIEQLLNAYDLALKVSPRADHRHRIEHFSLPTEDQIERAARLGVALGMQPNFAVVTGELPGPLDSANELVNALGYERWKRRHPYRRIVDSGVLVAGGSDADPKPMGPLIGIQALVAHPEAERRLTAFEALQLYTINGAKIGFEEDKKGTIAPGKLADLVVLANNPLTSPCEDLSSIAVEMTFTAGKLVHTRTAHQTSNTL